MRKNCILLSLAIAIAFLSLTPIAAADPYVCGDVDGSGGIDIDDVVFLIAYIFSGGPAPDPWCCQSGCPPTVTDYDGNVYQTVLIGDQCWMMENLKVTHYRNGDPIPNVTDNGEWHTLSTGAYCNYGNDPANVETYGRLYTGYAVEDSRNIAPEGWHVPSYADWETMLIYIGYPQGGKLKEAGTAHWWPPNTGATNESGFTALPGGYRAGAGNFGEMGGSGYFVVPWEGAIICYYTLYYDNEWYGEGCGGLEKYGYSVRCVRD